MAKAATAKAKTETLQAAAGPAKASAGKTPRMLERYQKEIAPQLGKQLGRTNRLALPRLAKIVLNMGCGEAAHDAKLLEQAQRDLAVIAGQKAVVTRAKKAISNFRIKEGDPVGCKVTLRRHRMYEFLDRLISVALPRIRDFRGLSKRGFDHGGGYSFGLREQSVFPELPPDKLTYSLGLDIAIVTTAERPEETRALLEGFGMPFEKSEKAS